MKFNIVIELEVDESSNILSTCNTNYEQDVADSVENLLHDLDDVDVSDIVVTRIKG